MLNRQQKEIIVREVAEALQKDKNALFVDYQGVDTQGMLSLRGRLRKHQGTLRVVRKTLLRRALSSIGIDEPSRDVIEGQLAVASGFTDPVSAAKELKAFRKELESKAGKEVAFAIRGGLLDGRYLTAQEAATLAVIPTRQELLAQLAGSLAAPMSGLLSVLSGPARNLLYALKAKAEK